MSDFFLFLFIIYRFFQELFCIHDKTLPMRIRGNVYIWVLGDIRY